MHTVGFTYTNTIIFDMNIFQMLLFEVLVTHNMFYYYEK